ncbi:MAG: PAS domain-containing protein, partial [Peptococcaceae bacterium]|nr:PAS domain-containing protein [Peptococcaceae bacterium]
MNQDKIIKAGFYALLDNTDAMIFMKDVAGVYRACSLPFAQMTGHTSVEDIIGKTDFEIFADMELAKRYTDDDQALLAAGEHLLNYVEPLTDEYGHPRYSNTSKYILRNEQGEKIGILGLSRDITKDYLARQRYQQELKYLFELPEDTYAALY